MALQRIFVGIDVCKDWLDIWIECQRQHHRLPNDAGGFEALLALIAPLGKPHAVTAAMEATGGYERALRDALLEAGVADTCVLNPLRVRPYARSLGRYAQHAELHPEKLDRDRGHLAELVTHRKRLIEERTAVSNQAALLRQATLREHARARIALIARQVEATEALIRTALGDMPDLLAKVRLMCSMKGVKEVAATTLAALLPNSAMSAAAPSQPWPGWRPPTTTAASARGRAPSQAGAHPSAPHPTWPRAPQPSASPRSARSRPSSSRKGNSPKPQPSHSCAR